MRPKLKVCGYLGAVLLACIATPTLKSAASNGLFAPDTAKSLDAEINGILKKNNLPSVAVGISVPGHGQYTFIEGLADLKTGARRNPEQPFRIASVTKPFAATAILVLIDRGQLHKTDVIGKWFPRFPNADRITIDDLLRMRSGIPAPNDDEVLARVYDAPLAPAPSFTEEMGAYSKLKAKFKPPNTAGVYTDFNYDILAAIANRITGKDIGELITQSVIAPLKLTHTSYPTGTGVPGGLHGYGWNPATKRFDDQTLFNPPLAGAAGAVISNIADLHVFARALCTGALLRPATFKERMQGKPLEGTNALYGEGVAMGSGVCGHSGTINGYSTDMYYFEKLNATLVISVNRLDRDNESQSEAVLGAVSKVMLSALRSK
jgi:D-alanyl-D-alanine carboxypeptidase